MINRILEFSLRQRPFIVLAALALIGAGVWAALRLPIDAVPDITNVQVQVNTEVPALAAEESEKLVTYPIEIALAGMPGVDEMRSLTKFGLSQVTIQFKAKGTKKWKKRQVLETDADGRYFTKRFKINRTGTWRAVFKGKGYVLPAKGTYKVRRP